MRTAPGSARLEYAEADERPVGSDDPFTSAAERIAVAGVLLDSAHLFTECLALVAPDVHARTVRITSLVRAMAEALRLEACWEFEVAARLSQIGCLALPEAARAAGTGAQVAEDTVRAFASHPLVGRDLLVRVRRLHSVSEMIARQREPYALDAEVSRTTPPDRATMGARLLHAAVDADRLLSCGVSPEAVVPELASRGGEYDPSLLEALEEAFGVQAA